MLKEYSMDLNGKQLVIKTGADALNCNGSAEVWYDGAVVLSTVTAAKKPKPGLDFFPLTTIYAEGMDSKGQIPRGQGNREGKPTDFEILTSRLIDRPIRPLFPKDFKNEVQIINEVESQNSSSNPKINAIIGTSVALAISDVPFTQSIGAVELGLINGKLIVNPSRDQRQKSDMSLVLAGTKERIMTIEATGKEIPENVMLEALRIGQIEIAKIAQFIDNIQKEIGKKKFDYIHMSVPDDMFNAINKAFYEDVKKAMSSSSKSDRDAMLESVSTACTNMVKANNPQDLKFVSEAMTKLQKKVVRDAVLYGEKRIDGRKIDEIRHLSGAVAVLPQPPHGSARFTRGETSVKTTVTLEPMDDSKNNFILHYNFPGYATGENNPMRGPGRREIGHGALALKALQPVMPDKVSFPYKIRAKANVTMSNGSSSQATICATTLALMDAGVPIKSPVGAVAAGLVIDDRDPEKFKVIMDLQGIEDAYGDMDFKVAGTKNGITAIQMDTKINGLTYEMMKQALEMTRKGRIAIIDNCILRIIENPRKEISTLVRPSNNNYNTNNRPNNEQIAQGMEFSGTVTRIENYGAFVEILPGRRGLMHKSNMNIEKTDRIENYLNVGDKIKVKVKNITEKGIDLELNQKLERKTDKLMFHAGVKNEVANYVRTLNFQQNCYTNQNRTNAMEMN